MTKTQKDIIKKVKSGYLLIEYNNENVRLFDGHNSIKINKSTVKSLISNGLIELETVEGKNYNKYTLCQK